MTEKKNHIMIEENSVPERKLDDSELEKQLQEPPKLDPEVLALLHAKQEEKAPTGLQRDRSLNFGVVGLGQAGARLSEICFQLGYDACAINTAIQDLEFIAMPDKNKLLLPFALGGAGKELDNGRQAVEQNADLILGKLKELFIRNEMMILIVSGGGGTGSGGAEAMIGLLSALGKPIDVIYILPLDTDDALSKHNAITTLGKLAKIASSDVISGLFVVDNAKIELLYPNLNKADFWTTANNAIITPIHIMNMLSASASHLESFDPMDFSRLITSGDCLTFGTMEVTNYKETTAIAEAIMLNMEKNLLSSDFNLKDTRLGGFLIVGSKKALSELPAQNIHYASHILNEICDFPQMTRGVYEIEDAGDDSIQVYIMLGGLGLPAARIEIMKAEAEAQMKQIREKEKTRASKMAVDYGSTGDTAKAQEIRRLIQQNKSGFGKLTANANSRPEIIDRRKR